MKFGPLPYKWYVAVLLFFAAGLNYADRTAITAVFPLLRRDLGMSDIALGATGTVFLWTYAAVSPFAGYFGDRTSRARLLTISLGAWSLVMALSALATHTTQLLIMRGVLGLAEAAYIPAATALIADHHGPDTRARAIGLHLAGFSVGMVGGGALAGYLGDQFGWRPSFLVLGVAGLVLTLLFWVSLRDAKKPESPAAKPLSLPATIRTLVRVPSFLVLTFENMLSGTVLWVFINWLPLFFQETYALSLAMAGLFGTLWLQGGRVAGVMLGGIPSDLAARKHPRYRMLIMVAAYALAAPLLTTFAWSGAWIMIAVSVFGFSMLVGMGYVNAQPLLCELLPEDLRSSAIGLMNMMSCFIGGAGVLIAGALKSSFGLHNAFASLGVIQASVALMLVVTFITVLPRDLGKVQSLRAAADPNSSPPESAPAGAERSLR